MTFPGLIPSLVLIAMAPFQARSELTSRPGGPDTSALAEGIRRAEYRFGPVKGENGVWSAPNRAHELRSRVSGRGLEVFPRATSADGQGAIWRLALATTSFGRADGTFALPPASVSVTDERVELDHGYLVEWFVNDERGIEQGWTIAERPIGSEPLVIGLAIAGDLALRIEEGGLSGVLVDARGEVVLRYQDLKVFDVAGRELGAWLQPRASGLEIVIDDAGASYPLTVDPVLTGPAWTAESDRAFASFGASVSTAGDVNGDGYSDVIVGAYAFDNGETLEGRAYVYLGSEGGLLATAAWTAEPNQASALFGYSVSTAGDVNGDGYGDVIVGAPFSFGESGAAYVYLGSAGGLSTIPAWAEVGSFVTGRFGQSVSTAGDVNGDGYSDVIVGAHLASNGQAAEGQAYVYLGSASGLAATPAWSAESNQEVGFFGDSVSTAGDVNGDGYSDVIVGAYGFDNGQTDEGRAYVYLGSPAGLSTTPAWTAESDQADAEYGQSVSTAGDVNADGYSDVIVGAPSYDGGLANEGRAYVYLGSSSGLAASPAWTAGSNQTGAHLGDSVSTAGDANGDGYSDVIVGAHGFDNGQTDEGRAYVYLGSATGLATTPAWTSESDQASAGFGIAVSDAGDVNGDGYSDVIVGAHGFDNGQTNEGRAHAYHGSASGLGASAGWSAESNQEGAGLGVSVAEAGDVNGDGYSDVVVGAYAFDNGQLDEGRALVYLGSATGLGASAAWTAESNQAGAQFGISVARAGDVNGDGLSDVIIGAYLYDGGQSDEGRAYVYLGTPGGLTASPAWTSESNQASAWFGVSVSTAGDVNADGYSDVIVGASQFDGGHTDEGRAYVYHGSATGLGATSAWTTESNQAFAYLGGSVSRAGDVNGDGYSDVIVGADAYSSGESSEGRAFVHHGSASGLAAMAAWTAEPDQLNAGFGNSVDSAGDVNGDGYSDVIVGALLHDGGQSDEGRAFVYHGSASGLAATPAWTAEPNVAGIWFGSSVAGAGDVNGDGYSDVAIGAFFFDGGQTDEGRVWAYLGSASGLLATPAWTAEPDQAGAFFGSSVSTAGDVNGDGYSDVAVGAYLFDGGQSNEGGVFVYLGNEGSGLVRALQQRTRNGARPLSVHGLTGESGLFRLRCEFPRNAAGYGWASVAAPEAWLEWEVKPLGVPFDGQGIQRGAPQSLVPAGGTLTFDEQASIDDAVGHARTTRAHSYHWRARVATSSPLFPNTAWFSAPGSNVTEAKLRKPALEFP